MQADIWGLDILMHIPMQLSIHTHGSPNGRHVWLSFDDLALGMITTEATLHDASHKCAQL